MKTVQAFSWALFCAFVLAVIVLFQLVHQAQRFGRWHIWAEPIRGVYSLDLEGVLFLGRALLTDTPLLFYVAELPWFGEMPGYYNTPYAGMYPQYPYYPAPTPMMQPGNQIIIQPGINGAPATVTQVPMPG
jgi:hypothetical protein